MPYKICSKHSQKRYLPELDERDSFIHEVNCWSQSGHTRRPGISYNFDLVQLSVNFGSLLDVSDKAAVDFSPLNKAVNMLTDLNQKAGGLRLRCLSHSKKSEFGHYYNYVCCQDEDKGLPIESSGKRDRHRMKMFDCKSKFGNNAKYVK